MFWPLSKNEQQINKKTPISRCSRLEAVGRVNSGPNRGLPKAAFPFERYPVCIQLDNGKQGLLDASQTGLVRRRRGARHKW